jgi:hypothetical protein
LRKSFADCQSAAGSIDKKLTSGKANDDCTDADERFHFTETSPIFQKTDYLTLPR